MASIKIPVNIQTLKLIVSHTDKSDNGGGPYLGSHRGEAEAMLLILLRRAYYSWLIFASSSSTLN